MANTSTSGDPDRPARKSCHRAPERAGVGRCSEEVRGKAPGNTDTFSQPSQSLERRPGINRDSAAQEEVHRGCSRTSAPGAAREAAPPSAPDMIRPLPR